MFLPICIARIALRIYVFICYLRTLHYLHVCCEGALLTIPTGAEYHGIRPPKRPTGIYIVPGPRNLHQSPTTLTGADRVGSHTQTDNYQMFSCVSKDSPKKLRIFNASIRYDYYQLYAH